jgi:hypothetical protein
MTQASGVKLPLPSPRSKVLLEVNVLSEGRLVQLFERTPGYGAGSARRMAAERASGGPFLDASDMNARVERLSHARLSSQFAVSFVLPAAAAATTVAAARDAAATAPDTAVAAATAAAAAAAAASLGRLSLGRECADVDGDVVFVTFNCCRMSPRAESFESKLLVIERLVSDTPGLSLLCLQELFGNASGLVAQRLRASTGDPGWTAAGCGSDASRSSVTHAHAKAHGVSCNAAVYNASRLRLVAQAYASGDGTGRGDAELCAFKRAPHVCVFEGADAPPGGQSRLLAVANVHISFREPRRELLRLGDLVSGMQLACARALRRGGAQGLRRDDVVAVVVGDFNRPACAHSPDFRSLHDRGFVELVSSGQGDGDGVEFLRDATSVAGNKLDNIFISRAVRSELVDAWVYQVGGAGRRLGESGRASAGRMRSERSDHLPVVAKLRLGAAAAAADGDVPSTDGPWRCRGEFSVHVGSGTYRWSG